MNSIKTEYDFAKHSINKANHIIEGLLNDIKANLPQTSNAAQSDYKIAYEESKGAYNAFINSDVTDEQRKELLVLLGKTQQYMQELRKLLYNDIETTIVVSEN